MTHGIRFFLIIMVVLGLLPRAWAQPHHDPLNPREVDELRDTRMEPDNRIKLLVKFTQARFQTLDSLRNTPKLTASTSDQLSQILEDIATLVDEIDDNLQEYDKQHDELRKGLRAVIDAETEFQAKLKALKESPAGQDRAISFGISNASESIESSLATAKAMLEDQNARKGKEPVEKRGKERSDTKARPDYTGVGGLDDAGQKK